MARWIAPQIAFVVLVSLAASFAVADEETDSSEAPRLHPMEIRHPPGLGTLDTGMRDASGAVVGVSCATCHAPNDAGALAMKNEVPEDFHSGIELVHGSLSCESCHAPEDRTRLRLATGKTLAMGDVMQLCGQCHGPKYRDFMKGAHGGGRGYWDRTQGPWIRNSCLACHSAHAPAYPTVMPAAPPNDRFLPRPEESSAHE